MARKRINILAIDGGGIRGIIAARIVAAIEQRCQKPASQVFDIIAGTSTGGIIACALALPDSTGRPAYDGQKLVELYRREGGRIFSRSPLHTALSLGGLLGPKYSSDGIESVLKQAFGSVRLHAALTNVLVTSYDTAAPSPYFFKSWKVKARRTLVPVNLPDADDFQFWEVARATSAAPTFFPPFRLIGGSPQAKEMSLIDGGVFANNPAMCAWAELPFLYPDADELVVASIGTGNIEKQLPYKTIQGWGLAPWARPLVEILIDGVSDTVEYELEHLMRARHAHFPYRFQYDLEDAPQDLDASSPEAIASLNRVADHHLGRNAARIDDLCAHLVSETSTPAIA